MGSPACLLCHRRHDRTEHTTCQPCQDRLPRLIRSIAGLHERLDPTPGRGTDSERGAPGFRSSSPADDTVLALLDPDSKATLDPTAPAATVNVLHGWVEVAAEKLPPMRPEGTVPALAAQLTHPTVLDWLCHQPWADETYRELADVEWALLRALGELDRSIAIGACPAKRDTGRDLVTCGGKLRARVYGETARCTTCRARWDGPDELRALSRQLGDAVMDAAGIARYLGIETSTVYVWAHRDRWRRQRVGRRTVYSLAAARASWETRHGWHPPKVGAPSP